MNAYDLYVKAGECRGGWPVVLANDIVGQYVHVERAELQTVEGQVCLVIYAGEDL